MASFDPSFVALRGTPEQTAAAAKEFKVFYAKVPGKTDGSYTVDHTAGSYVFDAQGKLRLFVRYGTPADALAADLKALLRRRADAQAGTPVINGPAGAVLCRCDRRTVRRLVQRLAHLLHRRHLDLADALGADAVLGGQFVQRHAARAVVVHLEPALLDDAAAARVERVERAARCRRWPAVAAGALRARAVGSCAVVGQVGDRARSSLRRRRSGGSSATSPPDRRVSISSTSSRLTFRSRAIGVDLALRQRRAVGVAVARRRPSGSASSSAG